MAGLHPLLPVQRFTSMAPECLGGTSIRTHYTYSGQGPLHRPCPLSLTAYLYHRTIADDICEDGSTKGAAALAGPTST